MFRDINQSATMGSISGRAIWRNLPSSYLPSDQMRMLNGSNSCAPQHILCRSVVVEELFDGAITYRIVWCISLSN